MYDPFGLFSDFLPQPQGAPQRPMIRPYTDPQEEESALSRVMGKVGGGLQYVGDTIDKPGRMVRGLLGGNFRELGNLVPFSDAMGLTDPTQKTTGEDLAKQWGLLQGDGEKGTFELRDLVGPAIEMGTDPLLFSSFLGKAATRGGNVATKVGIDLSKMGGGGRANTTLREALTTASQGLDPLAKKNLYQSAMRAAESEGGDLASMLGQKLGGHVGVGLPYWGAPNLATFDLSKPLGAAGTVGKFFWRQVPFHEPIANAAQGIGRAASALFHAPSQGVADEVLQPLMQKQYEMMRAAEGPATEKVLGFGRRGDMNEVRRLIETGTPAATPEMQSLVDDIKGVLAPMSSAEAAVGAKWAERPNYYPTGQEIVRPELKELARHSGSGTGADALSVAAGHQKQRAGLLEGLTFDQKNKLLMDPEFMGNYQARLAAQQGPFTDAFPLKPFAANEAEDLGQKTGLFLRKYLGVDPTLATPEQLARARSVADWTGSLSPERAAKQLPFFDPDPLNALQRRMFKHNQVMSRGTLMQDALQQGAGAIGAETVPLQTAVGRLLGVDRGPQLDSALNTMAGRFGQDILGKHVPVDLVNRLDQAMQPAKLGGALENALTNYVDPLTNVWKANMTVGGPWIGYQFRNWLGGLAKNFEMGLGPVAQTQAGGIMRQILNGEQAIPGIAAKFPYLGANDAEVTAKLADQLRAYGSVGKFRHAADDIGRGMPLAETVPGAQPWQGYGNAMAQAIPRSLEQANPFAVQGFGGRTADAYGFAKAGRAISEHTDDMNRGTAMLGLMMQGYSPEAAGRMATLGHVDFSRMSDFNRKFTRRAVPFASFAIGSVPWEVERLLEKPGSSLPGLAARVTNLARENQGFLPPHLGGGLAIPIGAEDETGTQRYLSRLGLPFEQAFDWIGSGPQAGPRSLGALAGQLNPMVKFPFEYITGKQLHTNREIGDMYSMIQEKLGLDEKPVLADQLLANSPFSRWASTYTTLTDPRKELLSELVNLGTGAKLTDVDMPKQRNLLIRDTIKEMLQGQPAIGRFESLYPKAGVPLSPRELELLRLQKTMEQRALVAHP